MSFRLQEAAWNVKIDGTTKLVLLRLAHYANGDGSSVFPSIASLSRSCGIGERTVQDAMKRLRATGAIVVVREADPAKRRPVEYRIDLSRLAAMSIEDGCSNRTGADAAPVRQPREPVQIPHPTGADFAPNSVIEPINEPSIGILPQARAKAEQPDMLADIGWAAFWSAYPRHHAKQAALAEYRKAIKKASPADIEAGARRYAEHHAAERTDPKFIAMARTWLHQERWADDLAQGAPPRRSGSRPGYRDVVKELAEEMFGTGAPIIEGEAHG